MKHIQKSVGIYDKYNHGVVVHIDFRSQDYIIVWVQYNNLCRAYWAF